MHSLYLYTLAREKRKLAAQTVPGPGTVSLEASLASLGRRREANGRALSFTLYYARACTCVCVYSVHVYARRRRREKYRKKLGSLFRRAPRRLSLSLSLSRLLWLFSSILGTGRSVLLIIITHRWSVCFFIYVQRVYISARNFFLSLSLRLPSSSFSTFSQYTYA